MIIYSLDYLKEEAKDIIGYWDGSSEKFIDGNGDLRTEEDVDYANDLVAKIKEVEELINKLSL